MSMRIGFTALILALPTGALAQGGPWTPTGGGAHGGWDWTPAAGAQIGGEHADLNTFTLLDGLTLDVAGASTAFVDAEAIVIDGNLNAVDQSIVLGSDAAGASIMAAGAGAIPALLFPRQDSFGPALPVFDWNDVSPPGSLYDVEISLDGAWGPIPVGAVNPPLDPNSAFGLPTMPTQHAAVFAFPEGATVFWRVRVSGGGPASETWGFRVDTLPPTAPSLLNPTDGGPAGSTPLFDWTDSFDASGVTYTLVVDDDCAFGSPEVAQVALLASEFLVAAPLSAGVYCWRVTAVDAAGNMVASGVGTFHVGSEVEDGSRGSHGGAGCSIFGFAAPSGSPPAALALTTLLLLLWRFR